MPVKGGRQWSGDLRRIKGDHVARYRFVADVIQTFNIPHATITDVACGVGYGCAIMRTALPDSLITGIDMSAEAIVFANDQWSRGGVTFQQGDVRHLTIESDLIVCYETIEHVTEAPDVIARFAGLAPWLICSVPNEAVTPFVARQHPWHVRHYTPDQLEHLLNANGFTVRARFCQTTKGDALPVAGITGRTLVYVASRIPA